MLLSLSTLASGAEYSITDIGLSVGDVTSFANGLNNKGDVVGYYIDGSSIQRAFLYSSGVFSDLGITSGGAYGINDDGVIVGTQIVGFTRNAFIISSGRTTNLSDGNNDIYGAAINAGGTIVGSTKAAFGPNTEFQACFSSGSGTTGLGSLGGDTAQARGINAAGTIVGQSNTDPGATHAFSYSEGLMSDLGTLGGNFSSAYGINTIGTIVGSSSVIDNGPGHAFSYTNGVMVDLGTLGGTGSTAVAINAGGQIVGAAQLANSSQAGFVFKNGTMQNLSSLVIGQSIFNATCINDYGQITALGTVEGHTHALLLSPTTPTVTVQGGNLDARLTTGINFNQIQDFPDSGTGFATTVSFLGGVATVNLQVVVSFTGVDIGPAASSVADVSGMSGDTYVLQITYDPTVAIELFGSEENVRLMWFDGVEWINAVDGNVGGLANFVGNASYNADLDFVLGNYGIDTENNEVWAVINHNSLFAVTVPEPSTLLLLGGSLFGLFLANRRSILRTI